jgi:hypothetical protein
MTSAGLSVGAIKSLKLKHLTRLQQENNIGILSVYPESKDDRTNAIITPECMASIDEYIGHRRKSMKR